MLALYPANGFTREMTFGGQRIVAPEEFARPGSALFGEFQARFDTAFGTEDDAHTRLDSVLGAQAGFWQLVSDTWISNDDAFSVRQAYVERPLLSKALRLRAGLIDATGCDVCFSGSMVGVCLGTDSLQGLLYSPRDTTSLDVTVGGEIDDIEIVVNGRKVRTERAFPGFHTVAVTALVDGVNIIEVFGVDRETGHRRLLASEERLASPTLLGKGRVEWQAEAGWDARRRADRRQSIDTGSRAAGGSRYDLRHLATATAGRNAPTRYPPSQQGDRRRPASFSATRPARRPGTQGMTASSPSMAGPRA